MTFHPLAASLVAAAMLAGSPPQQEPAPKPAGDAPAPAQAPAEAPPAPGAAAAEDAPPPEEPKAPATPLELAQRFTAMIGEGRGPEAIDTFFDFDAIARAAFPAPEFTLSAEDYATIAEAVRVMMIAPYADATVGGAMRDARYAGFDATPDPADAGTTIVSYTITYKPPINQRLANAVHVRRTGDGPLRVVDADTGRGLTLVNLLHTTQPISGQEPVEFMTTFRDMALKRLKDAGGTMPERPAATDAP